MADMHLAASQLADGDDALQLKLAGNYHILQPNGNAMCPNF